MTSIIHKWEGETLEWDTSYIASATFKKPLIYRFTMVPLYLQWYLYIHNGTFIFLSSIMTCIVFQVFVFKKFILLICSFSTKTMEKFTELSTFQARKTTFSSTLLVRWTIVNRTIRTYLPNLLLPWWGPLSIVHCTIVQLYNVQCTYAPLLF